MRIPASPWFLAALGGLADGLRLAPVIRPCDGAFGNSQLLGNLLEGEPSVVAQPDDLGDVNLLVSRMPFHRSLSRGFIIGRWPVEAKSRVWFTVTHVLPKAAAVVLTLAPRAARSATWREMTSYLGVWSIDISTSPAYSFRLARNQLLWVNEPFFAQILHPEAMMLERY